MVYIAIRVTLSDKLGGRKWLAVVGYALSAITKPFFYIAGSWGVIAGVRWADRTGKGIRTAPKFSLRGMGKPFIIIVSLFTLGTPPMHSSC